jgi:hypothetical protein
LAKFRRDFGVLPGGGTHYRETFDFRLNARAVSPDALLYFELRRAGLIDGAG